MKKMSFAALILTAVVAMSVCGCDSSLYHAGDEKKPRDNEVQMQELMVSYVVEKYGFEPKVLGYRRDTDFNIINDYMLVSDGTEEFTVWANRFSEITDTYEVDDIERDLTEWMETKLPGVYYVRLNTFRTLGKDQKYDGSGWAFLRANNQVFDVTAIYVNRYFAGNGAISIVSEAAEAYQTTYDVCFLNCPSEHAAEEMSKHSIVNDGGFEADFFEPYILQCLSGTSYRNAELKEYHANQIGNSYYTCSKEIDPERGIEYTVELSDSSISLTSDTFRIDIDSPDQMEIVFYIPLSEIDFDFNTYMRLNPDTNVVSDLTGIRTYTEGGLENSVRCYTEICGEYIRATFSANPGEYYFALVKK